MGLRFLQKLKPLAQTTRPQNNNKTISKSGGGDAYYNPNPLYRLIGKANELDVIVEGQTMKVLVDSRAQISVILALGRNPSVKRLEVLLEIEGFTGVDVPCLGYTEVNLRIPEIADFNEDILMLVYPDSRYSIDLMLKIATGRAEESNSCLETWVHWEGGPCQKIEFSD